MLTRDQILAVWRDAEGLPFVKVFTSGPPQAGGPHWYLEYETMDYVSFPVDTPIERVREIVAEHVEKMRGQR